MSKKIVFIAGEVSGDKHAAELSRSIKLLESDISLMGLGGEMMRGAGVRLWDDVTSRSSIGLLESLKHVLPLRRVFNRVVQHIRDEKPDLVVLVDYQGFNVQMAKVLKKLNIPTVYYFAPQYWIWATWRAKYLCRQVSRIIATFTIEASIYEREGGTVSYVGHPLLDFTKGRFSGKEEARNYFNFKQRYVIGLFPGSREQEINNHLDLLFGTARRLNMLLGHEIDFFLPLALEKFRGRVEAAIARYDIKPRIIAECDYLEAMQAADLIYCASGTSTLEVSIMGVPVVVFYKLTSLSYWLGRLLVRFPYASLPNIVMERRAVPELLQLQANPEAMARSGWELLVDPDKRKKHIEVLAEIKRRLGEPGAVRRAAEVVLKEAEK